jgi:hypothetical protein
VRPLHRRLCGGWGSACARARGRRPRRCLLCSAVTHGTLCTGGGAGEVESERAGGRAKGTKRAHARRPSSFPRPRRAVRARPRSGVAPRPGASVRHQP